MTDIEKKEITFRTEIEFKGSIAEFQQLSTDLVKLPVRLRAEWPPTHTAGCWPVAPERIIDGGLLEKITSDQPRVKILKDIYGGIRNPHFHIKDEIVLLARDRFQELVKNVAGELAVQIAAKADYAETLGAIQDLAKGGIIVDG